MQEEPKFKKLILGANDLSLGISIVIAILLGIGVGWALQRFTGIAWLFWLGVAWGIGAAILNIYKAYKRVKKGLDEMAKDPKYTYKPKTSEEK
ncbi:AtpZ/AtpI family protein [Helicobacter cappadocius]|uniref:AtpZ/AtpI family protein n=1 Tax=Helicobacter cappadocius TaxID=3063998 RepID=A0AA90SSI8_9HELI|nr:MULTISPECIES: AtpZ/AtpI family protein [unclassified Helicobacter]MDO7252896.1 AtpZ/AtpI family protein [Helicobacter sp. faydin-H75]MDP2538939.1 AtpZ/AtpI family protein [Helicobacter sp. faydin-H76]